VGAFKSGGNDVLISVAIDVCHGQIKRIVPISYGRRRLESAIAFSEQNTDRSGAIIGHDNIGRAITVEVADGHTSRAGTDTVRTGLERPIACTNQHRDVVGRVVRKPQDRLFRLR
jgi:hypothetical protein